jgi:hypothetical protein
MTKPARVRQSQIERAIRAANKLGMPTVEVRPDGTIVISVGPVEKRPEPVEPEREIIL